jgi:hypothetical protein
MLYKNMYYRVYSRRACQRCIDVPACGYYSEAGSRVEAPLDEKLEKPVTQKGR